MPGQDDIVVSFVFAIIIRLAPWIVLTIACYHEVKVLLCYIAWEGVGYFRSL